MTILITVACSGVTLAQQANGLLRQTFDGAEETGFTPEDDAVVADVGRDRAGTGDTTPVFGDLDTGSDDDSTNDQAGNGASENTPSEDLTTGSVNRDNTNSRVTRSLRQDPVGRLDDDDQFDTRGNNRVTPVEGGATTPDTDPYAPLGIRLGVFDLFPTLEQNIGYSSNADAAQNGSGSGFGETTAGLQVRSNWLRHSFQAEFGATYQRFFNGDADALPTANANATLRLDVGQEYAFTLRGGYSFATENVTSTNLTTGGTATINDRPAIQGFTSSAEFEKNQGNLRFSLRGSLDKTLYDDAGLSDGTTLLQGDRNNLLATVTGRISFEASPTITPFIEGSVGRRIYDIKTDSNGNQRDSKIYALRGGMELDFGEKLTGQVAIGYTAEQFKDANINTLGALTFDGSLAWSPVRLTTVTTTASTTLAPSANIDDNGSVIYSGSVGISRQVRPQLTLDANLIGTIQDYDTTGRRDKTIGVNAGYTYWFNRFVAATGRVGYEKIDSSDAGSTYDVGTIRFGLRFQR